MFSFPIILSLFYSLIESCKLAIYFSEWLYLVWHYLYYFNSYVHQTNSLHSKLVDYCSPNYPHHLIPPWDVFNILILSACYLFSALLRSLNTKQNQMSSKRADQPEQRQWTWTECILLICIFIGGFYTGIHLHEWTDKLRKFSINPISLYKTSLFFGKLFIQFGML